MTKKWMILAGTGLLAAVLILALVVPAVAQTATPAPQTPKSGRGWGRGFGFGFRGAGSWVTYDAAAKALGMTPEQLFTALHSGKTLDEIAEEKGVEMQTVTDAIKAAEKEAMKADIQQAVKDGKMTQEQADWMLQGVEKGYMPMGRRGRGFGCGGWGKDSTPSATPVTPTSLAL